MVVCPEPPAAAVGADILHRGGNAADAAVAAAFAQGATNPFQCGLGGTAILLAMDRTGGTTVLNGEAETGSGPVPAGWARHLNGRAEAIGRFIVEGDDNQIGAPSVMAPGFVATCAELLALHGSGRFSWAELIAPSIRLATGFEVYPYIAAIWAREFEERGPAAPGYPSLMAKFERDDGARRLYLKDGSQPYRTGDCLRQPALARTLDRIAQAGAADFYGGAVGRQIGEDLERRGSLVLAEDIASYRVRRQEALHARYRGHDVHTSPPPSPGVQLVEMLGILERLNIPAHPRDSLEAVDTIAQVMRAGFADNRDVKAVLLPEADAWTRRVTSQDRIRQWAERIARGERIAGEAERRSTGTTHVVAVDDDGLAISFTHSIGSVAGAGFVSPELGFLHNNFLGHFDPRPDRPMSILPGRRIGSGMPTIVRRDGRTKLVIGAPGGSRIITSILQVLLNVVDRDIPADIAVGLPRFHSEEDLLIHLEPGWPEAIRTGLESRGCAVRRAIDQARVQAIQIDQDGRLIPGADPRGGAVGLGPASGSRSSSGSRPTIGDETHA
ncbi:gamma-glutamyltransferase [Microvirga sp. BT291]|nr:gamma-glutamyltransferase [Microvirga pudoricolor]